MRRFTSIFLKRDNKRSDHSSSSSSTHSDHSTPSWKSWIGAKRSSQKFEQQLPPPHDIDEDSPSEEEDQDDEYDPNNIRIHIQNSLVVHPYPNSPFIQHPRQPIFPRSSNATSTLKTRSSTRISMFNAHLLDRLNSGPLSPSELSSILPFASKSTPLITYPILPSSDIARPKNSSVISSASLGIQRWVSRPCFEDRFIVYHPSDNAIQRRPVTSSMAIAALEYPEYLDVMVDPDFDQSSPSPEKNVSHHTPHAIPSQPSNTQIQSHASPPDSSGSSPISGNFHILLLPNFSFSPSFKVAPVHWRTSSTAVPSPLRIQHSPSPPTIASTKTDVPTLLNPALNSTVKRVVRFAEDDDDDGIPLHIVRMKKKREEKAKFLRIEQMKRIMEEEEERRLQEQEALERERRRLAKEKEKRDMDKAIYAEAVATARIRREGHRAGTILPSNTINSSNLLASSPSSTSLKNSERNKPLTDSGMLSSKPPQSLSIPRRDNPDFAYYNQHSDSSPGSSRSPSINHSPVSPGHTSRPPSMYSTHTSSSEEVRQQRSSRRNSLAPPPMATVSSGPSSYHRPAKVPSYPTWSGSSQTVPQVPPFPDFVHDMPLLPPTAPFMKYNRSKSPGPSSASSSRRGSFNSSNEHVNQPLSPRTSTSSHHHASTTIPPTSHTKPERRPKYERRSSGDSATLSLHSTQRPTPTSLHSQPILSRGRPALPSQYLQTPSPWLPLQNGLMPMPMPMGYTPMNGYPVLLYPTGPMPTVQGVNGEGGGGIGRNGNGWREPLIS